MGCGGSKSLANAPTAAKSTLLDAPAVKQASVAAPVAAEHFVILIDGLGASKCLVPAADAPMLRVEDVEAGPIAMWNNRARTDYPTRIVKKGDFVVKVKKVGESVELGFAAMLMLQALVAVGPFEVEVKRGVPEAAAPAQEAVNEEAAVETAVAVPVEDVRADAPVAAPMRQEVVAEVEVQEFEGVVCKGC